MTATYAELVGMTREQLVETYDRLAANTAVGLDWYRREIERRDADEQTRAMVRLAQRMERLTAAAIALAVMSVAVAVVGLFGGA